MEDCLFCKIIKGEIPSKKVYEDDHVFAFEDIAPMAKNHLLFIHKDHSKNVLEMSGESISQVYNGISKFAKVDGIADDGLRVVTNCGKDAGQTVFHTHFHVLYGEQLRGFGS